MFSISLQNKSTGTLYILMFKRKSCQFCNYCSLSPINGIKSWFSYIFHSSTVYNRGEIFECLILLYLRMVYIFYAVGFCFVGQHIAADKDYRSVNIDSFLEEVAEKVANQLSDRKLAQDTLQVVQCMSQIKNIILSMSRHNTFQLLDMWFRHLTQSVTLLT